MSKSNLPKPDPGDKVFAALVFLVSALVFDGSTVAAVCAAAPTRSASRRSGSRLLHLHPSLALPFTTRVSRHVKVHGYSSENPT